jgi:hypothetical protein
VQTSTLSALSTPVDRLASIGVGPYLYVIARVGIPYRPACELPTHLTTFKKVLLSSIIASVASNSRAVLAAIYSIRTKLSFNVILGRSSEARKASALYSALLAAKSALSKFSSYRIV